MKRILLLCIVVLLADAPCAIAQLTDTSKFSIPVELDTIVVRSGFDMAAFIHKVRTDTTFYKAFKSLHLVPFTSTNSFTAYSSDGSVEATLDNKVHQSINARGCRISNTLTQQSTGGFLKKDGSTNYYTADLFNSLFFSSTEVCNQSDVVAGSDMMQGKGRMEKNKYELKQMMFNPGAKVSGVPFMGDKASIFDPGQVYKYDFKVSEEEYNGIDCYIFHITPKPEYSSQVVYNELTTWFRRSDFSILARNYSLSFSTMFYSFNVRMQVRTTEINHKLYPVSIDYNGTWHVITKSREKMHVHMDIVY